MTVSQPLHDRNFIRRCSLGLYRELCDEQRIGRMTGLSVEAPRFRS
jgi:hypothetical protein